MNVHIDGGALAVLRHLAEAVLLEPHLLHPARNLHLRFPHPTGVSR
jgi:hypothetical protein